MIGEERLHQSINALVSHEMRNPLNSINAQIIRIKSNIEKMYKDLFEPDSSYSEIKTNILKIVDNTLESCDILNSSAKLLNFCVGDMLSLSQINSDKFRKNLSIIDIRKCVKEIIAI